MTNTLRTTGAALLALFCTAPALIAFAPTSSAAQETRPLRYVRAAAATKALNVADKNGVSVADVQKGTLLAVHSERAGWLAVEPPQGLTVWIYGQFLRPLSQKGLAEVTGEGVRMRPKPSSSVDSFPLEQQLHEGDRVRVVGRANPAKALREDWVQVISPPGVRAWVPAADTAAVEPNLDARAAWLDAVRDAQGAQALFELRSAADIAAGDAASATQASAEKPKAQDQGAWDTLEKQYEAAKAGGGQADWTALRGAYQRYLDQNPEGAFAAHAKVRVDELKLREEIAQIQANLKLRDQDREEKLAEAQARLRDASLSKDPLWGRFQARGWLTRDPADASRWIVQWSGKPTAEITCGNGRYELDVFQGRELGIVGALTRSGAGGLPRIDVKRIEVLSSSALR